ncbi:hypothetical protein PV433_01470 [Paenibacillus sp. GYB004]|uniref:hypothetical protein n=1 Tax=Paenibacillus sp. GYB004 TaxID=2994393 RepID=UPI002F96613F
MTAVHNIGDDVLPLINCFTGAKVFLGDNQKWLGTIQTGASKKYVKIPTFDGQLNAIVRITANPLPGGSAAYRKTALFSVYRYTDAAGGAATDYIAKTLLSQAPAGTAPAIDIDLALDTVTGGGSGGSVPNRYVIVAVPESWTKLDIVVE